jgi:hypothetical protein
MKPPPPLAAVPLVDQAPRPECIAAPGEMPKLDPRPMPRLPLGTRARPYRMPLWRLFEKLGD